MERLGDLLPAVTHLQDSIARGEKPIGIRPSRSEPGVDLPPNEPHCPKCEDGGWLRHTVPLGHPDHGRLFPCQCRIQRLRAEYGERMLRWSEMPVALASKSFEDDSWRQRDDLRGVFKACQAFAQGKPEKPWLVLAGSYGWGKTHLGIAILNWRRAHQDAGLVQGKYVKAPDFLADLKLGFQDDSSHTRLERYRTVGLLMLDDLGAQKATEWADEQLYRLLDYRYERRMETIITTNTPLEQLHPRLADRLQDADLVQLFKLRAPSYRTGTVVV